jgi:protein-tyrosine phosphatase
VFDADCNACLGGVACFSDSAFFSFEGLNMLRVLFVCANNFFLSPLAEGLLRHLARQEGSDCKVAVDSAGTYPGLNPRTPEIHAQELARAAGFDIGAHFSREVTAADVLQSDYIYVMTNDDFWQVQSLCPDESRGKLKVLSLAYPNAYAGRETPDPVLGEVGFDEAYAALRESITKCWADLRRQL